MLSAAALLSFFREAGWLDSGRVRSYTRILFIVFVFGFAIWIGLAPGLIDHAGKPLGTDFMSFYAASKLALGGHGAQAWDPAAHQAAEDAIFGRSLGYWAFFYPPPYLLLCLPLAAAPYGAALLLWLGASSAAVVTLARKWLGSLTSSPVALIPLLAFPALWINAGNGQNAAIMTAIALGGCLWLPQRPVIAGLLFGLLVMKPQLGLALPLLLILSGRWTTLAAAGLSALVLCLSAWLLVGTSGYLAFWHDSALARAALDQGLVPPDRMQSLFAALKVLGAPTALAYLAQALLALGALAVAGYVVWRHKPDAAALGALMIATTLLLTPFLLDYDLLLCAVPLGWLVMRGVTTGFRPWEKLTGLLVYVLPLMSRPLAIGLHVSVAPYVLLALYLCVLRRVAQPN